MDGSAVAYLFLGSGICTFLQHRELTDCLAINSGFAYYSLSSIFITEYRGAELGTIALLANIIREMATPCSPPLLARWFGPLAPISSGGATSMDTTLSSITQSIGQRYAPLRIYHGFVTDFTVPFRHPLVPHRQKPKAHGEKILPCALKLNFTTNSLPLPILMGRGVGEGN